MTKKTIEERDADRSEYELVEARGYNCQVALNVLGVFLAQQEADIVSNLSTRYYKNEDELRDLLAKLRVIHEFRAEAEAYIDQGRAATEELKKEDEDY